MSNYGHDNGKKKYYRPTPSKVPPHMWCQQAESGFKEFTAHIMKCQECQPVKARYCEEGAKLKAAYHEVFKRIRKGESHEH